MVEINYDFVRCDNGIVGMLGNPHLGIQTDIVIIKILFYLYENEVKVAQSCPTLCDIMDCSPPGSSAHGILQARVLEWVAVSFSRGIFPTHRLNPGLLHCRWILYSLSHQGSLMLQKLFLCFHQVKWILHPILTQLVFLSHLILIYNPNHHQPLRLLKVT